MSELERKLDNLLAADFGTEPGAVNGEFIRDWRESHEVSYEVESRIGGWVGVKSRVITRDDLRKVEARADAFLDRFSVEK